MNDSRSWPERHAKKIFFVLYLVAFLLAEGFVRVLASNGFLQIVKYPTSPPSEHVVADINPDFGVWRRPNRSVVHDSPCFRVTHASNSYGARDTERSRHSHGQRRVVALGDSFVEGYGVEIEQRMTNVAERITGIEFLNFGVSGNFGSIQQWLLYEKLASTFEHTDVAIFLLPANDFSDNDPSNFSHDRYRPYLEKVAEGKFKVVYPVKFEERQLPTNLSFGRYFRRTLYNNIYLLNVLRQIGEAVEDTELEDKVSDFVSKGSSTSYDSYTNIDLERLLFTYEQIVKLAGNRQVNIFVIPTELDFLSYESGENNFSIVKELEKFASNYSNVHVFDLLPEFIAYSQKQNLDHDEFTHSCDRHWSPLANEIAGSVLAKAFDSNSHFVSTKKARHKHWELPLTQGLLKTTTFAQTYQNGIFLRSSCI